MILTKESLDALSIFELRSLARNVGIKSPTIFNKDVLVDKILKIATGEAKPEVIPEGKPTRGRPHKPLTRIPQNTNELIGFQNYESKPAVPLNVAEKRAEYVASESSAKQHHVFQHSVATHPVSQQTAPQRQPSLQPQSQQQNSPQQTILPSPQLREFPRNTHANNYQQNSSVEEEKTGILEIHNEGYGFVRIKNYEQTDNKDAYVSGQIIKRLGLRKGDLIRGITKKNADDNAMNPILSVNGMRPEELGRRINFEDLTPIYPDKRFSLELPNSRLDIAIRCIDLISPIGKGQRGMIVSPPKAGKTTMLKKIANSISINHPDAHLIVLLIDERPEEVTDMQRSTKGEVVYSTFDENPEHHTRAAELVLARAKRLVEMGKDVIILMDSLTRLARAYNLVIPPTGRTLSGGIDPGALGPPKKFFGSARNIENGGSLTIIATALVDTGSRMDEVIYEEFKGTGNMEIHLDRRLSEKRIFPAIDLNRSSTRREELLLTQKELEGIWSIRKIFSIGDSQEATEQLITMMMKTNTNLEFIDNLQIWLKSLSYSSK